MTAGNLSNIDQLIIDFKKSNIECNKVFKLFYKIYPYKLIMRSPQRTSKIGKSYKKEYLDSYSLFLLYYGQVYGVDECLRLLEEKIIRLYSGSTLNVFFQDPDMFVHFSKIVKKHIKEISIIASNDVTDILAVDINAVIKKQYYFGKFPYRVQLKRYELDDYLINLNLLEPHTGYRWDTTKERVKRRVKQNYFEEWAKDNLETPFKKCKVRTSQEVPTLFFLEYQDVILFKMQYSDYISKIDKITLI